MVNQTEYYNALSVHNLNMINAYHDYQYETEPWKTLDSTLAFDDCVYEFTALLQSSNKRTVDIQSDIDEPCKNLQIQLSRMLLGNSFSKPNKNRLQPMLIGFFDFEKSRHGIIPTRCNIPHIHGFLVIHNKTKDKFKHLIEKQDDNRLKLLKIPPEFKCVSFQRIYYKNRAGLQTNGNEIEGIIKFSDYSLKSDKLLQKIGDNSSIPVVYPKNKRWKTHYDNLPDMELNKYN